MANTQYLKEKVEPFLRNWASIQLGVQLEKKKVQVGVNSVGNPVFVQFNGVSDDGTVGVCISASSSYKAGQKYKYFMDATLLNRAPGFKRRIMVFTNEDSWNGFKNQCDGLVDLGRIEPLICSDIPAGMKAEIQRIYQEAAIEVGDKSGPGKAFHGPRG